MSFIVLRLPKNMNGETGYTCCELAGHWVRSTVGLASALPEISTPSALDELYRHTGQSGIWNPGQPLEAVCWTDAGWGANWVSTERWKVDSLKAFEARFHVGAGHPESVEPWTSGGFAWCKEHGCWMSTVFSYGGKFENKDKARFGWHPAALTVWGWDRDPISEGPHALFNAHLLKMGENMTTKGAEALSEGVKCISGGFNGYAQSILITLQEIEQRAEAREIESATESGKEAQGKGKSRL